MTNMSTIICSNENPYKQIESVMRRQTTAHVLKYSYPDLKTVAVHLYFIVSALQDLQKDLTNAIGDIFVK